MFIVHILFNDFIVCFFEEVASVFEKKYPKDIQ